MKGFWKESSSGIQGLGSKGSSCKFWAVLNSCARLLCARKMQIAMVQKMKLVLRRQKKYRDAVGLWVECSLGLSC